MQLSGASKGDSHRLARKERVENSHSLQYFVHTWLVKWHPRPTNAAVLDPLSYFYWPQIVNQPVFDGFTPEAGMF